MKYIQNLFHFLFCGDQARAGWMFRYLFFFVLPFYFLIGSITLLFYGIYFTATNFILFYFLAMLSAFSAAVNYIKDIYALEDTDVAFQYFVACFFGLAQPRITISDGEQKSERLEIVEKIGGPAKLKVSSGYAVLTETLTEPFKVYGRGDYHLSRIERIYEIADLHEQEGQILELTTNTRDGIPVTAKNIKFNYRIWDSRWDTLYHDHAIVHNPFPFSPQAIKDFTYNRNVEVSGAPQVWLEAVAGKIKTVIREYINRRRFDDVIVPRDHNKDPRKEIHESAYSPATQKGLRDFGTVLRWWDPGEFESDGDVERRHYKNWSMDLKRDVKINQAYGEAQKFAYEELGRAEAEAELLMSIIHSLDGIDLSNDKSRTLQNLILMRTAQVIKALNTPDAQRQPSEDNLFTKSAEQSKS